MKQYLELVEHVLTNGKFRPDRTGTGTLSVFGTQTRYDLQEGFPAVTTKRLKFDAVVRELLWFLGGCTNINDQDLTKHTPIWDAWADDEGELGPIYGEQWRNFGMFYSRAGIDQIEAVISSIKETPYSRRHIVTAWDPQSSDVQALPPCHVMFQFYVHDGKLSCQLYQRSADIALGVPFNIASYALLTHLIARECKLDVGEFIHSIGDAHVYVNHIGGLIKQLKREPGVLPTLQFKHQDFTIDTLEPENVYLDQYIPQGFIKFEVSV